jgi:hypothetical protein
MGELAAEVFAGGQTSLSVSRLEPITRAGDHARK